MRSHLTIGTKVMASVAVLLAFTLGSAGFARFETGNMQARFEGVIGGPIRRIVLADQINNDEAEMVAAQRLMIIGAALKTNGADTGAAKFRERLQSAEQALREFIPLIATVEDRRLTAGLQADFAAWKPHFDALEIAARAGNAAEADRIRSEKTAPLYNAIDEATARLTTLQSELLEREKANAASAHAVVQALTLGMLALSVLSGAGVIIVIRRIIRELRRTVTELDQGAVQVASAAGQVASSSQSLAQGSSEQAASLEETSASSEEINSVARRNSETSRAAVNLVGNAQQQFVSTEKSLDQMVGAMDEINQSSEKISKIIKVIDEVAFQTNILALNAAVEAARAGEAGMGFAVVADEVRNLAQRCAQAAKDTASLIEESISKSHGGREKVDQVASAIRSVTRDSGKIKDLIEEVSSSSGEQSLGIEQVSKAILEMQQVTQRVAASAEESAAASQELTAQSASLKHVAERLSVMVGRE
jgi:methyl-accepting chemotaxis protein